MTESTQMHNNTQAENTNTSSGVKMEPPVSPTPSSEQQYSLKWNDFQQSILSSFRHLRDEEDFVDVTLACDRKSFTAHKVVLSACSPYFRKLLKANPCEHPIVILRDVRAEDVESLLRFMYNGEVHIGHEQLSDFLKTATLLQVRGLADVTGPGGNNQIGSSLTTAAATTTTTTSNHYTPSSAVAHLAAAAAAAAATTNRNLNSQLNASLSTPGVQELKASPTSTSLPWDIPSSEDRSNQNTPNPPPQKRVKSAELYRVQHGLSPDRLRDHISPSLSQHALQRSRDRVDIDRDLHHHNSRDRSRESRDHSLEMRESLLGQALEGGPTLIVPSSQLHPDIQSLQAQSTGEDSCSSDGGASDRGDLDDMDMNGDHPRTPTFPGSFMGLQGMQGLLPGTSGMHGSDNFDVQHQLMIPAISIKTETEDRFSPTGSSSLSSCLSVAPQSGPGGNTSNQLSHHHQQQQQHRQHQQQQLTARLFLASQKNFNNMQNSNNSSNNNHLGGGISVKNNLMIDNTVNASTSGGDLDRNDMSGNSNYLLPCPLCDVPLEPRVFRQHLDRHYPRDSPVCPVLQCGRRFAHPNSVRNHMRLKHTMQWAKMKAMRSSGGPFSGLSDYK